MRIPTEKGRQIAGLLNGRQHHSRWDKHMRSVFPILVILMGFSPIAIGQTNIQPADLIRLAEARRLASEVRNKVWPGWEATPFPVLLVTAERELLVDFPGSPPGFTSAGYSAVLRAELLGRPRQFDPALLATFPAFELPPVIVIGRSEATNKMSAEWALTVLHEHFHQYQMYDPEYFTAVDQLGLSGGDQSGMWMLNYPFPYQSAEVAGAFAHVSRQLALLLKNASRSDRQEFWKTYGGFLAALTERDRRYLSFQVWQEGIARYVELRVAEAAADGYVPSFEFLMLPDVKPFSEIAVKMRTAILTELENPDLQARQRVSFYAFGAGLALLLDQENESWKRRYLSEKFFVERYAGVE